MKIAVCCKLTPDSEDIKPNPDGSYDTSHMNWCVSEYDLNALTAASDLHPDDMVVITAGDENVNNSRVIKRLMATGDSSLLIRVCDKRIPAMDTAATARVLAAAVKRSGADVVLFGEGSADRYQRIMGAQVAAELGWPSVNAVDAMSADGNTLTVERDIGDSIETLEVQTPCAISVTSTINVPPLPAMKAVLAAGKKPIDDVSLDDLGVGAETSVDRVNQRVPEMPGRQKVIFDGDVDESAAKLVARLKADKVL